MTPRSRTKVVAIKLREGADLSPYTAVQPTLERLVALLGRCAAKPWRTEPRPKILRHGRESASNSWNRSIAGVTAVKRVLLFVFLVGSVVGCGSPKPFSNAAPSSPSASPSSPPVASRIAAKQTARSTQFNEHPFANLAEDMSSECIRSAGDVSVPHATVYYRCVGAYKALLNAPTPQPYRDDNAVTASAIEIYAAYALRQSDREAIRTADALINDAATRLSTIEKTGSRSYIRTRARAVRSCLVGRAPGCLKHWVKYQ